MALPILDGNQSATTLSTILSSGQHITAHTVVSLGTQAITDIVNATSAGLTNTQLRASAVTVGGTVTVGNSLTISSLPAISGTVTIGNTVNFLSGSDNDANLIENIGSAMVINSIGGILNALPAGTNRIGVVTIGAGTVTIGAGTAQIGSVTVGNSVTIGSLPAISGTVTANVNTFPDATTIGEQIAQGFTNYGSFEVAIGGTANVAGAVTANSSNGSLTTRFGSVTTANTAFATSAVTNASRKYLLIQNVTTASNVITVGIGFTPTTTQGIQLSSGAGLTFEGSYIPTGAVNLLSSVTASCFTILEA